MDKFQPDFLYITPQNHHDIEIIQCGTHECARRQHIWIGRAGYCLHPLHRHRQGLFQRQHDHPSLSTGDMFLITPDNVTAYYADMIEPYTYIWVGFTGERADALVKSAGLSQGKPRGARSWLSGIFRGMLGELDDIESKIDGQANALRIQGELLRCIGYLTRQEHKRRLTTWTFSDRVADFIHNNISNPISITRMAADFGFSRTYFSDLFKKGKGVSPQQYLINYRVETAARLLEKPT